MPGIPSALLLTTTGDIVEIDLPPETDSSTDNRTRLAVMYAVLRCTTVDCIALTTAVDMWVDDEGLYHQPPNPFATALAHRYGHTWQHLHGPVLLTGGPDDDGNTLPLDLPKLRAVLTALADVVSD